MKSWLKENRRFILFLICFGLFRSAVADWNPIPSGSMRPNLLEGDVVLVNRLAYDLKIPLTDISVLQLGQPARGDVVTFSSPKDGTRLIKRLIALPGDTVEMRDEVLYVNGQAAQYAQAEMVLEPTLAGKDVKALRLLENVAGQSRRVQLLETGSPLGSFAAVTVPAGQYLMLGDNRDNSGDSRVFGFVPRNLIIGHAHHIVASADIKGNWMPRFERFGQAL